MSYLFGRGMNILALKQGTSSKFMTSTGYRRTAPQALPDLADSIQVPQQSLYAVLVT